MNYAFHGIKDSILSISHDILLAQTSTSTIFQIVPRRIQDQSIVIVEDDPYISESLKDYFSGRNSVQTFTNAEDTLAAKAQFSEVKVFILDYKLPGTNGIELFKQLQSAYPAAKFILITGEMSYDMAEESRNLGLDALILKPFDFTILEDNISSLISTTA